MSKGCQGTFSSDILCCYMSIAECKPEPANFAPTTINLDTCVPERERKHGALLWQTVTHFMEQGWCAAACLGGCFSMTHQASELFEEILCLLGLYGCNLICSFKSILGTLESPGLTVHTFHYMQQGHRQQTEP